MNNLLKNLKAKLQERKTSKKVLALTIQKLDTDLKHLEDLDEARSIFQKASQVTQTQLANQVSVMVSSALAAVFDDPYTFVLDFVKRRNATECDLWFSKNGKQKKPLDSCGFGAADIASLALRIAYWKLDGETRNVLILDEPFRNLSIEKQPKASMMISQLSKMNNGLQFIIVTHSKKLTAYADKVFKVEKIGGVSHVIEIEKTD